MHDLFRPTSDALPAASANLRASWLEGGVCLGVFGRFGFLCLCPGAERTLRKRTPVALKNATMNGCLFWGPWLPTSPATLGFTRSPVGGKTERQEFNIPAQTKKMSRRRKRRFDPPSALSRTSNKPRFWPGFKIQWLLVAVRSNTSQPSSAAQITRESSKNRSESLPGTHTQTHTYIKHVGQKQHQLTSLPF